MVKKSVIALLIAGICLVVFSGFIFLGQASISSLFAGGNVNITGDALPPQVLSAQVSSFGGEN
jgi:hypothetical protein